MLHLSATCKYYLCRTPVDMRKGFDSLSGMVTNQMGLNVLSGALFIFFNKNYNQVKLLLWEGDGFSIYYKRLEKERMNARQQQRIVQTFRSPTKPCNSYCKAYH
jgi:transposase